MYCVNCERISHVNGINWSKIIPHILLCKSLYHLQVVYSYHTYKHFLSTHTIFYTCGELPFLDQGLESISNYSTFLMH